MNSACETAFSCLLPYGAGLFVASYIGKPRHIARSSGFTTLAADGDHATYGEKEKKLPTQVNYHHHKH